MNPSDVLIQASYTWFCGKRKCASQHKENFLFNPGDVLPRPKAPAGWHLVGNRLYCDKHEIQVRVDGKRTTDCMPLEHHSCGQ
jgi:hypothetical protein